jgi:uncharacterized membrane protein HdeD (DUF308 family)
VGNPRSPLMLSMLSENWWMLALRGLLSVLFGFAALVLPLGTLEAVGRLFGVYAILEGALVVLIGMRGTGYRGPFIAEGAFGIVVGLVAFAWPGVTALVLLYVVAIWAILSGMAEIIAAALCGARSRESGFCLSSGYSPSSSGWRWLSCLAWGTVAYLARRALRARSRRRDDRIGFQSTRRPETRKQWCELRTGE